MNQWIVRQSSSLQNLRRIAIGVLVAAFMIGAGLFPSATFAASASPDMPSSAVQSARAHNVYHTVRPGDTLTSIARHYGVSIQAIMRANGITNPNHIYVGQVLVVSGSSTCVRYHTVQYGQTLSHIALYYGVSTYALAQANNISNQNHVYTGQKLCIPASGGPVVHPAPAPSTPTYYTVRPGDSLSAIAYRYRVTLSAIMAANGIANPNRILVGQVLVIPSGGYVPQPHPQPQPHPTPVPAPPAASWTGIYYNNTNFSGSPVLVRQDAAVNFNWGFGGPGGGVNVDQFSVIWTTEQYFSGGTYRFLARSDDGVRVYVDDRLIIDGWGIHPVTGYFADVSLTQGNHRVRVEYFENFEQAVISVNWTKY